MQKYLLLTISLILTAVILTFGQAAYHKKTSSSNNTNNNAKIASIVNTTKILPTDNKKIDEQKNKKTEEQKNESTEEIKNLEIDDIQNTEGQTPATANANITTIQTPEISSSPTIATQPTVEPTENIFTETVQLKIQGLDSYNIELIDNDNGWDIMRRAADKYAFLLVYKNYGWGVWVKQIGNFAEHDNYYWALYHNGQYSQVGISDLKPQPKDIIEWKLETW